MAMDTKNSSPAQDWHPADVKAALEKKGVSLRKLAHDHGYSHFQRVLTSPWWAAEAIVAKALNRRPEEIWPSRYVLPRTRGQARTRNVSIGRNGRIKVEARA